MCVLCWGSNEKARKKAGKKAFCGGVQIEFKNDSQALLWCRIAINKDKENAVKKSDKNKSIPKR
ncbi:CLUMA_CG001747, isoform A [Clunio marinus]|uniref:CLUMA_CG001747, isoform A n=1 Tax=Clunio marinus TaxID=568069 RepID=A0A1J1HP10_9DIPT|nr:CLUMA_CG001747, isoform A [Clunio marinus]